jgi:hypothetical protein
MSIRRQTAATPCSSAVLRWRGVRSTRGELEQSIVPLAEVIRFTGHSRIELLDLVRSGVLEEIPGRGACQLTISSLRAWMTASA